MKIIDLTHTFTADIPVYPGDEKPLLEQVAFLEKDSFNNHKVTTEMHVGTHMDAPLHMIANGATIDEIPLDKCIGKGILLDVRGIKSISADVLKKYKLVPDSIVLLYTGCADNFGSDTYFNDFPAITEAFAQALVDARISVLGVDMPGVDVDQPWPIHKLLLANNIYILENLVNLDKLISIASFEVIALPAKFKSDGAPVRVIAREV